MMEAFAQSPASIMIKVYESITIRESDAQSSTISQSTSTSEAQQRYHAEG